MAHRWNALIVAGLSTKYARCTGQEWRNSGREEMRIRRQMFMGFILLFIVPYQIRLAITADGTRTAVLLVPAAQLFGLAIGPIAASLLIDGKDFRPVPEFAAGSALVSVALLGVFVFVARRRRVVA